MTQASAAHHGVDPRPEARRDGIAGADMAFYATDSRLHLGHLIGHLFVIAGLTCDHVAVLGHAA